MTRTDLNGEFAFPNLRPGQYRLTVTCDGFIRQEYQKRIVVGGGQQVGDVLFELEPAPTVTGWVLDSFGEPIAHIMVEALHRTYDVRGNPRLARAASALTDDRGEYRIFWLDPGEYFFYASSALPDSKEEQPLRVVTPTYFPGVRAPDDARSLRLDIGREIRVDFRLSRRVSLWKVSGQTMNGGTSRSIAARITLTPSAQDPSFSRYRAASSATGREPGQFSILNVVPGSYVLTARSGSGDQELSDPRQSRGLISMSPSKGHVKSRLKAAYAPTACSAAPTVAPPAPGAECILERLLPPAPPSRRSSPVPKILFRRYFGMNTT